MHNLALPHVYRVTVISERLPAPVDLYVAADFTGSAVRKAQRACVDGFGFRPNRHTTQIKLQRLRAADYLKHLQGVQEAYERAKDASESDIAAKLSGRVQLVLKLAGAGSGSPVDHDAVWQRLCEEMGQ